MADITIYPSSTQLSPFDWSTKDHPNPRLSSPISSADTTIYVTDPPLDKTGAVITSGFLMGIKNSTGATEVVYVPPGAASVDGSTLTGCVRGISPTGLDYTTGNSDYAMNFDQDSPVSCVVDAFYHRAMIAALQGDVGSGGTDWYIGDETDSDITVYAKNADANSPFFRYDKTTDQWVYSNDGTSSTPFGTGAGVTGGDGITITAGGIDVDLTDTVIFTPTTAGVGDAGKAVVLNGSGLVNQSVVEVVKDITSTASEINQVTDGVSSKATATNISALTGFFSRTDLSLWTDQDDGTGSKTLSTGTNYGFTTGAVSGNYEGKWRRFHAIPTNGSALRWDEVGSKTLIFETFYIANSASPADTEARFGLVSNTTDSIAETSGVSQLKFLIDDAQAKIVWNDASGTPSTENITVANLDYPHFYRIEYTDGQAVFKVDDG